MSEKHQIFNGLIFTRDDKTGYYLCSKEINGERPRIHRYIWQYYNGEIPNGYHVHHKDKDKSNNTIENLELVECSEHLSIHANERDKEEMRVNVVKNAMPKAKKWHSSEEGLKWHSEQSKKNWEKIKAEKGTVKECIVCGKEYTAYFPKRSKYCSNKCKAKALRCKYKLARNDYVYDNG